MKIFKSKLPLNALTQRSWQRLVLRG